MASATHGRQDADFLRRKAARFLLRAANVLGVLTCIFLSILLLSATGCRSPQTWKETVGNDTHQVDAVAQKVDHPVTEVHAVAWSQAPVTLRHRDDLERISYRDMTLDDVLRIALQNSDVLRELGGTVLRNPAAIQSRFTGQLAVTDPRFSPEAALSAFDAQLRTSAYFSNNDRLYNNPFFAGGTNAFKQDLHEYEMELSKVTATGSQMALRSISIHDANNAPGNIFRSAWDTYVEGEIRKPMLQGGGVQFNRIAGPGSSPGVYNGVLLAKVNADVEQTDFEIAVRDYVNDVTNAYWDLYYAYRDLDARIHAMDRALEAWNRIKARAESDLESGAAEALAREQYYRFKADVDEAISGRVSQGTRTGSGSTGGTLEASGGVQTTERRLRLLIGLPITDGELIRPADEPLQADVVFNWDIVQNDAMQLRPELRRQQMIVRRREMELLASRNFLNPRLDAVGRYRFRGFGDDLIRTHNNASVPSSAVRNMMSGDQQEWFVGFEYEVPIGYRKAHLAVTNAQLLLSRERIIQREQQREVIHDLTNAIADAARAYEACQNSLNRYLAARELLTAYEVQDQQDMDIDVDHLLDAQRRVVEAEIRYFRARTEYAVALKNVHLEKGSLLSYHNLHIFDSQTAVSASRGVTSRDDTAESENTFPNDNAPLNSVQDPTVKSGGPETPNYPHSNHPHQSADNATTPRNLAEAEVRKNGSSPRSAQSPQIDGADSGDSHVMQVSNAVSPLNKPDSQKKSTWHATFEALLPRYHRSSHQSSAPPSEDSTEAVVTPVFLPSTKKLTGQTTNDGRTAEQAEQQQRILQMLQRIEQKSRQATND